MADKRDLALNDLSRYKKTSNRLVLEDYSHCEVPAGCGGGILRWIDPAASLPLKVWLWSTGKVALRCNGAEFRSSRVDTRPGKNALAIHLTPTEDRPPQIALALLYSAQSAGAGVHDPSRVGPSVPDVKLCSGGDLRVVATLREPPEQWVDPLFDDAGWTEMRPAEPVGARDRDWHLENTRRNGGRTLGLRQTAAACWIRCTFTLALGGAP